MRRTGPILALSALLAAALLPVAPPGATARPPATPIGSPDSIRHGLVPGDVAYVDVAVATLWTKPGLARRMDRPSLSNPVDLRRWSLSMQHTADREWLSKGKLETQVALGSRVQVTAVDGAWVEVVVPGQPTPRDARGYPGWLPATQLEESARYGRLLASRRHAVVTDRTTWLSASSSLHNPTTEIGFDTRLPVLGSRPGVVEVALPNGRSAWVAAHDVTLRRVGAKPPRPTGQHLVDTGSRFLGLRYLWAGASAFGFDCSGFTYTVHRAHGITIPRDSGPQSRGGTPVARADLRPGDLVFFAGPGGVGHVHHVAMYAGNGRILHSPDSSRNVEIVDLDRFDVKREYTGARRYR